MGSGTSNIPPPVIITSGGGKIKVIVTGPKTVTSSNPNVEIEKRR